MVKSEKILLLELPTLFEDGRHNFRGIIEEMSPVAGWVRIEEDLNRLQIVPHVIHTAFGQYLQQEVDNWIDRNTRIQSENVYFGEPGRLDRAKIIHALQPNIYVADKDYYRRDVVSAGHPEILVAVMNQQSGGRMIRDGYEGWNDIIRLLR